MAAALREATGGEHVLLDPRKSPGTEKPHGSQSPSLNPLHREFSHHVRCLALLGRDSSPLAGDGSWSEDASGQHWCMEDHQPPDWWGGVYQLHGEEPWAAQPTLYTPRPPNPCPGTGPVISLPWVKSLQFPNPLSKPLSSVGLPSFPYLQNSSCFLGVPYRGLVL